MLKLVVLSALLAAATAADVSDFYGEWFSVMVTPPIGVKRQKCIHAQFSEDPDVDKCRCNVAKAHTIKYGAGGYVLVLIAEDFPDVERKLRETCYCDGRRDYAKILLSLDNEYHLMYSQSSSSHKTFLMARRVPSESALREYVGKLEGVNFENGEVLCTTTIQRRAIAEDNQRDEKSLDISFMELFE